MASYKVLVANRGEIAIRVLRAATELGWTTVAIYHGNDVSHATYADEVIELDSPSRYMDAQYLVDVARRARCTHVHPAYGFLSENADFAALLAQTSRDGSPPISFVGPPPEVLRTASDKMLARNLAISLDVPVAPGTHIQSVDDIFSFARSGSGYPLIVKALDGGGGRGIRIIRRDEEVEEAFRRCLGESPSRQLFVESAMIGPGWKHVEVQIVGDGTDEVIHLWERECSVQRRFQKIIEMAPSSLPRERVQPLLEASLKMGRHLKYRGLGTFEFLVDTESSNWIFLEVNPRLQVEHTITEEITGIDIVHVSLLLSLPSPSLRIIVPSAFPTLPPPRGFAIQLRLTAEDPIKSFQLSTGALKSSDVSWPGGRGVRVDTWLSSAPLDTDSEVVWEIGTDFDSLLAKIIIRAGTSHEATRKASRALRETRLPKEGVKTNLQLLAGVMAHNDWLCGQIDTLWLERNIRQVLDLGQGALLKKVLGIRSNVGGSGSGSTASSGGSILIQPGTTFNLTLSPLNPKGSPSPLVTEKHSLTISEVAHNAFPDELSGTLQTTLSGEPFAFHLSRSTSILGTDSTSFEHSNPRDPGHISVPLTGKIVELHSALLGKGSGNVSKGETLVVISVMKMETVITAPIGGKVERLGRGIQEGVVVPEGMLLCVVQSGGSGHTRSHL